MREEQKPIAAWIRAILAEKSWTPYRWAKETDGRVAATTITRAISETYRGVTSNRILSDLAKAAGVAPPIEIARAGLPEDSLREVLSVLLTAMGVRVPDERDLAQGARLLRSLLEFHANDPEGLADPKSAALAARALAAQPQ